MDVQYQRKGPRLNVSIIWRIAAMLLARLHCRCRRRRAYAPTSNAAAHNNHEKINSWVSFSLHGYGALLGGTSGRRSSAINGFAMSRTKSLFFVHFFFSFFFCGQSATNTLLITHCKHPTRVTATITITERFYYIRNNGVGKLFRILRQLNFPAKNVAQQDKIRL